MKIITPFEVLSIFKEGPICWLLLFSFPGFNALPQMADCKDSFPVSFLLNHSFEEYSGCYIDNASTLEGGYIDGLKGFGGITVNNWHSFTDQHHEIHYFNYNCRLNNGTSIFDSTNTECYSYPQVPLPLPDGVGFISINENDVGPLVAENKVFKSYVTTCLSQPLNAGEDYVFSFILVLEDSFVTTAFNNP